MTTLLEFFNIDIETLGKTGVYSIYHKHDDTKLYIGSTSLKKKSNRKTHHGFYRRFYEHVRYLKLGVHHSKHLQNVVNKYGIEGLIFSILETCDDLSVYEIREREQYYITKYAPSYNSFDTVHPKGRLWTKEDKNKASIRLKGKKLPDFVYKKISKPIYQLDKNGNFIAKYNSKAEAAKLLNIDSSSICNCALGKRKSAGGFKWTYQDPNI
jgi:hypothetical protein